MRILVTAPTALEIEPFISRNRSGTNTLVTGVGGIITLYHLMDHLKTNSYDLVIQAGICGSFDLNRFPVGEVVLVDKDAFGDIGIIENKEFSSMVEIGFAHEKDDIYTKDWLVNDYNLLPLLSLPKACNLSMNTITDNKEHEAIFLTRYHPDVEAMEGAAFHYLCLKEKIPFLQIRAISNAVGERDKSMWQIVKAIENLTLALYDTIDEIKKLKADGIAD